MLLVCGGFKNISGLDRLELVEVAKDEHREATKHCVDHGDLPQSEVQVVEHVCRDHADLVNNDAPQVSEEQPLLVPLLLRHAEKHTAKLKPKQGVQGLPIDVGRRCTCEGGEDNVGAAGIVAGLLEGLRHHGVDGVDQPRLSTSCATVHNQQGCRGLGQLPVRGGQWEGDKPLGIMESHGEHLLLPCIQMPCLLNLKLNALIDNIDLNNINFKSKNYTIGL